MVKFYSIFYLFVAGILLAGLTACKQEAPSLPPTNIVFIMVDDLGSADLGCYGSTDIRTPNIDQLAKEGLLFTQAYSGSTVCAPARSTLMTGQHTGHTPVRGNTGGIALPDAAVTIAEVLKQAGYATGGFGKWGIGEVGTEGVPENQGFDRFFGYYHQIHAHDYYPEYLYENSKKVSMPGIEGDSASYTAYRIFEETKAFIRRHKDQPFFCYAPWTVPHGNYTIPKTDPAWALYANEKWDEKRKNYAAMVSMIDRQVGEIVQLLKALELEEHTLLIFCSDNGGGIEFADYKTNGALLGFKRDLYEGGIRVPMIARQPGTIPAGTTTDLPVYFPDMLPTLADMAGAAQWVPATIDGVSIRDWLIDPQKEFKDRILYWEYPHYDWAKKEYPEKHFKQAVRYGKWKLLREGNESPWEFYDMVVDPGETDNISPYHPNKVKKFREWIAENHTDAPPQIEPERIDGKPYR